MTLDQEPVDAGRHRAPASVDVGLRIADVVELEQPGRHSEPAWVRELFDPCVDEDPFDWLGFAADAG